ncbi:MAG: hypothetical protein ABII18_06160 [bacterium]|nr:hypothetical protein [bacterium]MBU1917206.1 hypothetical protein [bacterium]
MKEWTRQEEVYGRKDFYASMKWIVTFQSEDFLKSKINKLATIYGYSGKEMQALITKEQTPCLNNYCFYVSFYAYDRNNGDLANKDSDWQLLLDVDGKRLKPTKIEKIDRITDYHRSLFPYSNIWSRHYLISFPKNNEQNFTPVTLSIRGPFGQSQLEWK